MGDNPMKRREFLLAGAVAAAAAAVPHGTMAAETTATDAAPVGDKGWDDGLAHPIPYQPKLGTGKQRGLALGGGGAYLASWMVGYFHGLKESGVDLSNADIAVGTSAGSLLGASLMGGEMWRLSAQLGFFGRFPGLFAKLVPTAAPNPSQSRARHIANTASKADPATIMSIGRAAMAARNPANSAAYQKTVRR